MANAESMGGVPGQMPASEMVPVQAAGGNTATAPVQPGFGRRRWLPRMTPTRAVILLMVLAGLAVGGYFEARYLWAQHQFELGRKELDRQHFKLAQAYFEKGLAVRPDDIDVRIANARAHRMSADTEGARQQLDACKDLPDPDGRVSLARDLLSAQTDKDFWLWNPTLARRLNGGADDEAILEVLASGNLRIRHNSKVMEYADQLLKVRPNHLYALIWKGEVFTSIGNLERGTEFFQQAVTQDPDFDTARELLANAMLNAGRASEALPHAQAVYEHDRDNPESCFNLARCYRALGKYELALELLDKVLRFRPGDRGATGQRAVILYEMNPGSEEAEKCLRRAYAQDSKNHPVLFALSRCLEARHTREDSDAGAAAAAAGGSVALQGYSANTEWGRLNGELKKLDRGSDALKVLERQVADNPNSIPDRMKAASLAHELGMYDQELNWLLQALALKPTDRRILTALAHYYEEAGDVLMYRHYRDAVDHAR